MLPDTLGLVAGTLGVLSSFWSGAENAIFYKIRAIICVWELKFIPRNSKRNAPYPPGNRAFLTWFLSQC
jgi:hypothetical protein